MAPFSFALGIEAASAVAQLRQFPRLDRSSPLLAARVHSRPKESFSISAAGSCDRSIISLGLEGDLHLQSGRWIIHQAESPYPAKEAIGD